MNKSMIAIKPVLVALLVVGMTTVFSGTLLAQDTLAKKQQKVFKLKTVDKDENGEFVTMDTTIFLDENTDMVAFQRAMKEYQVQMKEMGKHLKEIEIELDGEEIERAMQEAKLSLQEVYREMPHMQNYFKGYRVPRNIEHLYQHGNRIFFGNEDECCDQYRVKSSKRGETLSDVLGDIPMSAVTNYKIKETKNGKRITIEVSDDLMEDHNEDIIIWNGYVPAAPSKHKIKKEILIKRDKDTDTDTDTDKEEIPE